MNLGASLRVEKRRHFIQYERVIYQEDGMGHLIQWDNEDKSVVLQQYVGTAFKEDLYSLATESARMLNSVSHTVHLIIDERNIKMNLNAVDMQYLEKLVPVNQGGVVMIVSKKNLAYKKFLQNAGEKLAPKTFEHPFFATNVEDARQLLQSQFQVRYP